MFDDRERTELDRPPFDTIEFGESDEHARARVATLVEEPAGDEPVSADEFDSGAIGLRGEGRRRSGDDEEEADDNFEDEDEDDALDEALDDDFDDDEFEDDDDELDDDLDEEEEEEEL
jgi:hypothetical protein